MKLNSLFSRLVPRDDSPVRNSEIAYIQQELDKYVDGRIDQSLKSHKLISNIDLEAMDRKFEKIMAEEFPPEPTINPELLRPFIEKIREVKNRLVKNREYEQAANLRDIQVGLEKHLPRQTIVTKEEIDTMHHVEREKNETLENFLFSPNWLDILQQYLDKYPPFTEKLEYPIHKIVDELCGEIEADKSTICYPTNTELYGDLAGKPVQHYKIPTPLETSDPNLEAKITRKGVGEYFLEWRTTGEVDYPATIEVDFSKVQVPPPEYIYSPEGQPFKLCKECVDVGTKKYRSINRLPTGKGRQDLRHSTGYDYAMSEGFTLEPPEFLYDLEGNKWEKWGTVIICHQKKWTAGEY